MCNFLMLKSCLQKPHVFSDFCIADFTGFSNASIFTPFRVLERR